MRRHLVLAFWHTMLCVLAVLFLWLQLGIEWMWMAVAIINGLGALLAALRVLFATEAQP